MADTYKPTQKKERLVVLDVLRGFALVGILFANILSWSGIKFMLIDDIRALGDFSTDVLFYNLLKYFVDTKFYTIFSILFGIGFSMQIIKYKDSPGFIPLYRRRLALLFVIGLLHAMMWSGDILTLYALVGFVLVYFRNLETKNLLRFSIALLLVPVLTDIIYMFTFASDIESMPKIALKVYPDMFPTDVVAGFQSTNFLTVFKTNFHNVIWRWYDFIPSGRPFKVLGLFLLGSYLYSSGYFQETVSKIKTLLIWLVLGFGFTILSMNLSSSVAAFSTTWSSVIYKLVHEIGQISLALSYISLIAVLLKKFSNFFLWNVLKAYGRMSLTSYIGHSVLGIIVFYPIIGFSFFGKLSLENVYYIALAILLFQLTFSVLWFKWFKFGPIEWAWRCLTYKKMFPIRYTKIEK